MNRSAGGVLLFFRDVLSRLALFNFTFYVYVYMRSVWRGI
jgi:hypothetical protein